MERSLMNIMIKLVNIIKEGNIIKAKVIIQGTHPEEFDIEVDLEERKIIKCTRECTDTFVANALAKLVRLSESGDKIPKEAHAVWY